MTEEAALIEAMMRDLSDHAPALAYADWLGEHERPEEEADIRRAVLALEICDGLERIVYTRGGCKLLRNVGLTNDVSVDAQNGGDWRYTVERPWKEMQSAALELIGHVVYEATGGKKWMYFGEYPNQTVISSFEAKWSNFNDQYTPVSREELIAIMREAGFSGRTMFGRYVIAAPEEGATPTTAMGID